MSTVATREAGAEADTGRAAPRAGYGHYLISAYQETFSQMLRRKRAIPAILVAYLPVLVPVVVVLFSQAPTAPSGESMFVQFVEKLHLRATAPLLALFFACMLVGEEAESNTIPYILTRPVPRSAWVLGKLAAYASVTALILVPALFLLFGACTALSRFPFSGESLGLTTHYAVVLVAALLVYGSLSMLLGALTKRPVVYAVVLLFGWQRVAVSVPGVLDFLTLEKYLTELLPPLAVQRDNPVVRSALVEFQREAFLVGAVRAAVVLAIVTAVFTALTAVIVRHREFTAARAAGV